MKRLLLALLLAAVARARAGDEIGLTELPAGRYAMRVSGMLCTSCARAIDEELKQLRQIESASFDWDRQEILFTVRAGEMVPVSALRKALRRARPRVNLPTTFELKKIAYRVAP